MRKQPAQCPHCGQVHFEFSFQVEPRFSTPFGEAMLLPLEAPRSSHGDFIRCSKLCEELEWLLHELRTNGPEGHPEVLICNLGPIASSIGDSRGRRQWPRFVADDERDPLKIFWDTAKGLVKMADKAARRRGKLDADVLQHLVCRTWTALSLQQQSADVRFEVLEWLLEVVKELADPGPKGDIVFDLDFSTLVVSF